MGSMGGPMGGSMRQMSPGRGRRQSDTVIVRNLPMDCNWQSLKDRFSHTGDIKFAEMKERGTGLVRFGNDRDAERAVNMMDKQRLQGQAINVELY